METHLAQFINHAWGSIGKDGTYPPFFPGPQPISIERRHFKHFKNEYYACEKTDGVRIALVCLEINGTKHCCTVDRAMKFQPVVFKSIGKRAYNGTILDGEMVTTKDGKTMFMVYDAVLICGENVKGSNFKDRLDKIKIFIKSIMKMKSDPFLIKLKTFYNMSDIHKLVEKIKCDDFEYKNDGLIFTPVRDPIRIGTHETMFKWKPRDMNTIDFIVKNRQDGTIGLYVQEKGEMVFYTLIKPDQITAEWRDLLVDNTIVECKFLDNVWPKRWEPTGIRSDKTHPNNRRTLNRTMVNIREDIQLEEFIDLNKQR